MALDKITTGIIADDAVTAAKIVAGAVEADIRADAIGTAEIANDVTISTSGNIATTGSGTLTVAGISTLTGAQTMTGDTTHNGNVIVATNKKVQQKGAFMQSSTHQALILGY
jgi:hypothetical protein